MQGEIGLIIWLEFSRFAFSVIAQCHWSKQKTICNNKPRRRYVRWMRNTIFMQEENFLVLEISVKWDNQEHSHVHLIRKANKWTCIFEEHHLWIEWNYMLHSPKHVYTHSCCTSIPKFFSLDMWTQERKSVYSPGPRTYGEHHFVFVEYEVLKVCFIMDVLSVALQELIEIHLSWLSNKWRVCNWFSYTRETLCQY